jgi:uncharacterized membrane protein
MSKPNKRIIFLDLMRALAVIMMIQGHTIDAFLGDQYRSYNSSVFDVWFTLRGFTAPIFMFTSGVTFMYLFRLQSIPFIENPRVKKGMYRVFILILVGYLLRFPTPRMLDFSEVTHLQWMTFFTVDALHLIGFGLLMLMVLAYIAEKYKRSDYLVFSVGALILFSLFFITEKIHWANFIPIPFAGYLYSGTGSLFPLFPWSGYVVCGGILGSYLAKNPESSTSKKFSYKLIGLGAFLVLMSEAIHLFENNFYGNKEFWTDNAALLFYRVGIVIMLNGFMSLISMRIKGVPKIICQVGKNTLLVYAVHAIIIYGNAWIPGFAMFYPKSLNIPLSILAAFILITLMFGVVSLVELLKSYRNKKFVIVKI